MSPGGIQDLLGLPVAILESALIVGIVGSVIASGITLLIFRWYLSPNLRIAGTAVKSTLGDEHILRFKVINDGRREAIDLRFELFRIRYSARWSPESGGVSRRIPLQTEHWHSLQKRDPNEKRDDFYLVIRTKKGFKFRDEERALVSDVHKIFEHWDKTEKVRLRLRVLARDAVSQVEKSFAQFFDKEDAIFGSFLPGSSELVREYASSERDVDDAAEKEA